MSKTLIGLAPEHFDAQKLDFARGLQAVGCPPELQLAEGIDEDAECVKRFKAACKESKLETKISNFNMILSTSDLVTVLCVTQCVLRFWYSRTGSS